MAAATVDKARALAGGSMFELYEVQLSALTSDQLENVTHYGPSSVAATFVLPLVTTGATSGDQVTAEWVRDSDSTANNTVAIKARVSDLGDITGAKLSVFVFFFSRATAGLNPP